MDVYDSRFVCVIVQYVSKFDQAQLVASLVSQGKGRASRSSFNFQMASPEDSARVSGFEHNALVPFGMNEHVPVGGAACARYSCSLRSCRLMCGARVAQIIMSKAVSSLHPPVAWLGGGEVLLKLRVPTAELRRIGVVAAECTSPRIRDGDTWL